MFKKFIIVIISFIFLFTFHLLCFGSDNLIHNSSFEEVIDNSPTNWETTMWVKDTGFTTMKVEEGIYYSGNRCVSIINNKENDSRFVQVVSVKDNTYYKLSCWTKTNNVGEQNKGACIAVEGLLETSKDIKGTSGEWVNIDFYFKTEKINQPIKITCGIGGYSSMNYGTAYFDDVKLEELKSLPDGKNAVKVGEKQKENHKQTKSNTGPSKVLWWFLTLTFIAIVIVVVTLVFFKK